jgi:hypothetical protein
VQYVKSGNFETEGPLGESNLYVLSATMIKTGIVYNGWKKLMILILELRYLD